MISPLTERGKVLKDLLDHCTVIMDGAMGTMIQKRYKLEENDFREGHLKIVRLI